MSRRQNGPWPAADQAALITVNLLCGAAVLSCWVAAGLHIHWHPQLKWLEAAMAAAGTAAVADGMWLLHGMHRVRDRRREVLARAHGLSIAIVPAAIEVSYVTAVRMQTYHLPSCLLVRDKQLRTASEAELEQTGHRRCRMCLP